ncbi:MAG: transposase, partial [Sphingomonadales bacterium]|nr:transposase [Sphingomonadales bacterium]
RLRLIKISARVVELKTMIRIQWPTACPYQKILQVALDRIPRLIT